MVYRTEERHHPEMKLRLDTVDISKIVESNQICCTHYDAFRFFSDLAKPLNQFDLKRESVLGNDQAGCIHANMDLYKFGYKIAPYVSSKLLGDLFLHAKKAREIDMKASPYDLSDFGMTPIKIEHDEGKNEYLEFQRKLYRDSSSLRQDLLNVYLKLFEVMKCQSRKDLISRETSWPKN
jgi:hypothetical protein